MVIASLAGAHLLRNDEDDVSVLASLFYLLFEHYASHSSPTAAEFIQELRTLAGLGFTVCLSDEVYTVCYQPYLNCFLQHHRGDFQRHQNALLLLSQTIANMVMLAVEGFRVLYCPLYYEGFMRIVKHILADVTLTEAGQSEKAKQMFELLQRRRT
jgi:hypothetical protein